MATAEEKLREAKLKQAKLKQSLLSSKSSDDIFVPRADSEDFAPEETESKPTNFRSEYSEPGLELAKKASGGLNPYTGEGVVDLPEEMPLGYGDIQVKFPKAFRDAVEFIKIAIEKNIFNGGIFNVGSAENYITMSDLAILCKKISNKNVNISRIDYDKIFSKNHDDILFRSPCCEKMNTVYKSKYTNADIIESMLNE